MDPSVKLRADNTDALSEDPLVFRKLVGKMMYLTITHLDITFTVNKLCHFASSPC